MNQRYKVPSPRSQLVVVSEERKYPLDGIAVYYFKLNVKKMLTEDNVHRVSPAFIHIRFWVNLKITFCKCSGFDGRDVRRHGGGIDFKFHSAAPTRLPARFGKFALLRRRRSR
jgi:hypothetical protein